MGFLSLLFDPPVHNAAFFLLPPALYFEVLFISSEETETRLCRNGLFYYLKIEKNDN